MQPEVKGCSLDSTILAELLCSESPIHDMDEVSSVTSVPSYFDPAVLHHPEVLGQLRFLEGHRSPRDYYANGKDHIVPHMRKVVSMWMLEVCEEQSCEDTVFPLAVGILDQFLGCVKIKAQQLQLLACVCLLLASKIRQESHFSLQLLSWYTENSVTLQTLMTWELMVLSQLNWDVNIVTATDFVDFLLARTPSSRSATHKETQMVRRHAITFISMCCTEPRLVTMRPSVIAAAAIFAALKGIGMEIGVGPKLASMASITVEDLMTTAVGIDQVISTQLAGIEETLTKPTLIHLPTNQVPLTKSCSVGHQSNGPASLTPTDVQDIRC